MSSLVGTIKQVKEVLDQVMRTIELEYENGDPETDRREVVGEEQRRLDEVVNSKSCGWRMRNLLGLSPPEATGVAKECLKEAEKLHRLVKEDIESKRKTKLTKKSNVLGLSFSPAGTRRPEAGPDTPGEGRLGRAASPPNTRSEAPKSNASPAVRDYVSDLNEAINTPLGTSSDPCTPRRRRAPPPPPPRRQMAQSESVPSSPAIPRHMASSTSSAPRRTQSVRRTAPSPPQSPPPTKASRASISGPVPQHTLDPALIASLVNLAQRMQALGPAAVMQQQRVQSPKSGSANTNRLDIRGSNVDGLTINNDGKYNSGAVIHKTTVPPQARAPQHVPQ